MGRGMKKSRRYSLIATLLVLCAYALLLLINGCPNPMLDAVKKEVVDNIPTPKNPSISDGILISDTTPLLGWEDVSGAAGYHLQVNEIPDFTGNMSIDDNSLTASQYQVTTPFENGKTYYWRVKVKNADGLWGNWSRTWSFTVDIAVDIPVPQHPSPIDGDSESDATPLLDWEDVGGATGYHLQVSEASDFSSTIIDDNSLTASQYQVTTPFENGKTYYWRVKVKNADGVWGNWSGTWTFTVDITLKVPANPSPPSGSSTADTTPLLDWEDITSASAYHIQVNTAEDFNGTVIADDYSLTESQYQIGTVLTDNTTYYWRVRIKNEDGIPGEWSSTWSFTVDIAPPVTPSPQDGANITDNTPLLDWEDVTEASGYHVQVNTDSTFTGSVIVDDSELTASLYQIISDLSSINTTYFWRVKVKNADGVWGDWSETWSFTIVPAITIVDSTFVVGMHTSIALDSNGYPHISYYYPTYSELKYAKWTGSSWSIESAASTAGSIGTTSIALDSSDYPHIAYYDKDNYDLKYTRWTGSIWSVETVDSTGDVGEYCSIALESNGYAHISYRDATNDALKYAKRTGSGWSTPEIVDSSSGGLYGTSIALDSNGYPHISYEDSFYNDLEYAKWIGDSWSIEIVDGAATVKDYTSMALDDNDYPHISYFVSPGDLKYARWTRSSWSIDIVDTRDVGQYNAITIDGNGYPHISYYDYVKTDLKYARWTGSSWSIDIVDSTGDVGQYNAIAIDSNGYVHISYYDATNGDLKYAKFKP